MNTSLRPLRSLSNVAVMRSLILLVSVLLTCWSQWGQTFYHSDFVSEWLRDRFIQAHASTEPETRITIIDIDETSLATLGAWPWPRKRIADLLENLLSTYAAKGIALDLIFPEPADADGDMRLAMLAQHGPIVLAQAFDYETTRPSSLRIGKLTGDIPLSNTANSSLASGFIANHAGFAQARYLGNIGFIPDSDGTIRHLPTYTAFEGRQYATLSLALLNCCATPKPMHQRNTHMHRIPFARDWNAYTVIPAASIFHLSAPKSAIEGRLILIGSSSLGLTDRVATPLSASTAGVMVHASALTTLLDEQAGQTPQPWPGRWIAVLYSILIALIASYTFPRFSAAANAVVLSGASLLWIALSFLMSSHDPYFFPSGPLLSTLFLLGVAVPFDWQITQKKSKNLLGTLRQYVADAVVDELLRRHLKDPLAPEKRTVTTLIADMEGYTSQVESLSIEEASELTRDFLDCLTRPVLQMHGTLDKYTGDGLVAFWGAPLPNDNHADLALDAAYEIVQEVRRLSHTRQLNGKAPLRVRIGIESGDAMAGDFGTSFRSIYTAVGDSVNVASRLEQVARDLPHDIIIGQGTANCAKRHQLMLLGDIVLRGKEKPTTIFTLEIPAQ